MVKSNELSSTERLLNLIRQKDTGEEHLSEYLSPGNQKTGNRPHRFRQIWPSKRKTTIGCEITTGHILLVQVAKSGEHRSRLVAYRSVPIDPDIPQGSSQFSRELGKIIKDFAGTSGGFDLWYFLASPQAEIRNIVVPKVPRKQLFSAAYWTFKRKVSFDEKNSILDFEVLGDITEGSVKKTEVTVYVITKQEIEEAKAVFEKGGLALTGICISPFDIQNLIRSQGLDDKEGTISAVRIGEDWSLISLFSSGNVLIARFIRTGISSMLESIREEITGSEEGLLRLGGKEDEMSPASISLEHETEGYKKARQILFGPKRGHLQTAESAPGPHPSEDEILRMIKPPLDRLIKQIERSFKYYDSNFERGPIKKIFIGGEISSVNKVVEYISDQLGTPYGIIDPFASQGASIDKVSPPESIKERVIVAPAVGTALSENTKTPNCLFTFEDKEKVKQKSRINKGIFLSFLFLIVFCFGFFLWQEDITGEKERKIETLENRLAAFSPNLERPQLVRLAGKVSKRNHQLQRYADRYSALGVLGEVSRITPSSIRLLRVQAALGPPVEDPKKKGEEKTLVLEGVVVDRSGDSEGALGNYLMELENSGLFDKPRVRETERRVFAGEELFFFAVSLKVI